MSTHPVSNTAQHTNRNEDRVTLVIRLCAVPSARLTQKISAVLNHHFDQPYSFLGSVDDNLVLDLHLSDPGLVTTEALAKRLLRVKGVKRLKAERVCTRRGPLYAISLTSSC